MSLTRDQWAAVNELLSGMTMIESLDGDEFLPGAMVKMTVMTENNGWAIVWMNNKYYLRHLACGAYIRRHANWGCLCKTISSTPVGARSAAGDSRALVDDLILKKFKLITKGDSK